MKLSYALSYNHRVSANHASTATIPLHTRFPQLQQKQARTNTAPEKGGKTKSIRKAQISKLGQKEKKLEILEKSENTQYTVPTSTLAKERSTVELSTSGTSYSTLLTKLRSFGTKKEEAPLWW